MGTVSGGVEGNLTTNVPDAATLASLPTQSFRYFDLASVDALRSAQGGSLFFYDPAGTQTVDSVTVIATKNGTGRWLSFAIFGGATISVATVAELKLLPDTTLKEGTWAYVRSLRAWWSYAAGLGGTADDITLATALSGGAARWVRQVGEADPYWAYQTVWYVDPVAGNDENTGAAANAALKTIAEQCRRLRWAVGGTAYTVNVLANVPSTDLCNPQIRLLKGTSPTVFGTTVQYIGQRTVVRTGTTAAGTTQTNPAAAAATAQAEITDATVGWAADRGELIVAANGDTAWVLTGKTNAVGSAGRVSDWRTSANAFSAAGPGAGAAYSVVTLTTWQAQVVGNEGAGTNTAGIGGVVATNFQNFHFNDLGTAFAPFAGRLTTRFITCKFSNQVVNANMTFTNGLSPGAVMMFTGSLITQHYQATGRQITLGGLSVRYAFVGSGIIFTRLTILSSISATFSGICIQGGWVDCGNNSNFDTSTNIWFGTSNNGGWFGVYNDYDVIGTIVAAIYLVRPGVVAALHGSFYGIGDGVTNITGIRCDSGARITIKDTITEAAPTSTTAFNFTPSGTGTQLSLDGLAATMPNITASAGAVLPATTDYRTFTLYRTTFGRNAKNYANYSAIISSAV